MDEKRKGEIALAVIKAFIREQPIRLKRNELDRGLEMVKTTGIGIPLDELMSFYRILIWEIINEVFA